jgi:hypothetical protein
MGASEKDEEEAIRKVEDRDQKTEVGGQGAEGGKR